MGMVLYLIAIMFVVIITNIVSAIIALVAYIKRENTLSPATEDPDTTNNTKEIKIISLK